MKKGFLLAVILLCGLMVLGCGGDDGTEPPVTAEAATAPAETPEATEAPAETEAPKTEISLSWAKAFRISTLPEGEITPDEIAFYAVDRDGNETITNVPKDEVFAYRPERLPRTRTLEQYIPDKLDTLLVTLDYALAHGYSRFSIPTTEFTYADILGAKAYLNCTYYNDNKGINTLDVQSFETDDGKTLTYILVTISGIPDYKTSQYYLKGVEEAQRIVDSVPEGSTEYETALYLYQYLTDNVVYDFNEYYENGKKVLLYDALVKRKTVCAGYTEALYYLYNLAGIDCMIVSGYISDPQPLGYHVWNVARIDGQYYQFDATWDSGRFPNYYEYFAVSDEYMMAHHTQNVSTFSLEYMPECPNSLFPELVMNGEVMSDEMSYILFYYRFLDARETAPMDFLIYYGKDPDSYTQTDAGDGWVVTDMQYRHFRTLIRILLDDAAADRFCEGYYEDRDGMLAYRKPQTQGIGWRVTNITEKSKGTFLTEAYFIDQTGGVQFASHLIRIKDDKIVSVSEP